MRPLVLICAVVGVGVGASCTPSSATDESPSPPEADPEGVVFKGPMAEGTDVRITRVDAGLEAVGEPVVATVGASGRYTAAVPSAGIVRLVSEGLAYDEAKAAFSEEATTLRGFGEVGAASAVHLNLLTDLSEARVVALVGEGESFVAATLAAEQAVARALAVGDGRVPDRGAATEVYGDAFDAAWLLAVSSLVSQAGVLREAAGTGTRATVIDDLRAALAAGGPLPDDLAALLAEAERTLDPEIPRLGLEELQRIQGRSERLPALGQVLDSDGDGVVNRDDRCPFDAADDCNHEVLAVAFGGGFGCVVRARDGTLRCWRDDAGPIGGTPPRPDGFPAPPAAPWGDAPGLDGTDYLGVEMGDGII